MSRKMCSECGGLVSDDGYCWCNADEEYQYEGDYLNAAIDLLERWASSRGGSGGEELREDTRAFLRAL